MRSCHHKSLGSTVSLSLCFFDVLVLQSGAVKTLKGDGSKANGQTAGNNDASA